MHYEASTATTGFCTRGIPSAPTSWYYTLNALIKIGGHNSKTSPAWTDCLPNGGPGYEWPNQSEASR